MRFDDLTRGEREREEREKRKKKKKKRSGIDRPVVFPFFLLEANFLSFLFVEFLAPHTQTMESLFQLAWASETYLGGRELSS